jgi:hypothetical protein
MKAMLLVERLAAAAAVFVAAHFAMGFINSSAGGSGGSLLFPFATNARLAGYSEASRGCWGCSSR